jgi:hypothetical protein
VTEPKRVRLHGFEEALATLLTQVFRYSGLEDYPLVEGRNVWVQHIPEDEEILVTSPNFDPKKEPVLSIMTNPDQGLVPASGAGSRHQWDLRFLLRYGTVHEEAKAKLESLMNYLALSARGKRAGKFLIKGLFITTRPVPFSRGDDDHSTVQAVVRFMGVPVP